MSYMQPDITNEPFVILETRRGDYYAVPQDVCGRPPKRDGTEATREKRARWFKGAADFVDGPGPVVRARFYSRSYFTRAPGYLEATEWAGPFKSEREARAYLSETYDLCPECLGEHDSETPCEGESDDA